MHADQITELNKWKNFKWSENIAPLFSAEKSSKKLITAQLYQLNEIKSFLVVSNLSSGY